MVNNKYYNPTGFYNALNELSTKKTLLHVLKYLYLLCPISPLVTL